ncbi:T9SS type A sorting domain-containing protein [Bacteroidota bacterium]
MKNLHFFIIVFLFLFFSNNSYGQNDYLKSSTNTGTATTSGTAYSNVAATTINLNGDITKVMVVAGMNMKGSGTSLLSRLSWYNIINSSNADLSGEISRLVDKTDDDDYGIGSLVHIFDVTGISGNVTYTLQHKNTTAAAERNVETTAYITAIALNTEINNYTVNNANNRIDATDIETESATFAAVTGLTTSAVTLPLKGAFYVAASINCNESKNSPAVGEWKLQYQISGAGSWTDLGIEVQRTMASRADDGMVTLVGVIQNLVAGDYLFQVAHRRVSGTGAVATNKSNLIAVALAHSGGGYFPSFHSEVSGGTSIVGELSTGSITSSSFTAPPDISGVGTNLLVHTQYNAQASNLNEATPERMLAGHQLFLDDGINPVQEAIAFQRRLSNNTDIGSGGFVGLAEDLEQNASITVTMKHSIDDILNQEGATDETLTTSAVILTGFQTYDQSFYTWDGSSSTAWATADNWANGVAPTTTSHDVTIPDVSTNDPIISSARSCNTVFIRSGGSLTISAALTNNGTFTVESNASESGSLILSGSGSVSGDITYQRYMTGVDKWHLISSPVVGQDIGDFITASGNSIATKGTSPVYYAMSDYNEAGDVWNGFFESTVGGNFTDGKGYEALRSASGNISFTGTVRTTDVTGISITRAGEGWNLLGNPYPSAINANSNAGGTNFLTTNSASLDPSFAGVYFWNAATSAYVAITNASAADYVPPGQGFFVRAKDNSSQTVGITEGMQSHQTDADFKSANTPWPSINLIAESEDATSSTYITFNSSMTRGLDITYDAGVFRANPDFSLYSRLVEDNGINFTIQCLPEEYDDLVIPIGLDAPEGLNVTFRAEVSNLPDDCTCYLENRDAGTYTQLKAAGSSYDIEINRANVGVGAFFLHTSFKTLGIDNRKLSEDSYKIIVNQAEGYIRIVGDMNPNSIARVYDLAGRLKKEIQLPNAKDNRLTLTNLKRGIYILQIMNKNEVIGRKISW